MVVMLSPDSSFSWSDIHKYTICKGLIPTDARGREKWGSSVILVIKELVGKTEKSVVNRQ